MCGKGQYLVFHGGEHVTNIVASDHGALAAAVRKTGKPMNELVTLSWGEMGDDVSRAMFCAALKSAALDPNFWQPADA